jgi:hypothetical protein
MDWKSAGKVLIKNGLPLLGTILGGPAVGAGVNMIASSLGQDPEEMTPADVVALSKDPGAVIRLKEIESTHKIRLQELSLERDALVYQDRAGARNRQIAVTKATGKTDVNLYVLAWTILIGFFTLTGFLVFRKLPDGNPEAVFMLFGALASGFGAVVQYFFGSSKSSAEKDKRLADKTP